MDKIKIWWAGFWSDTKKMAKENPWKTAFLIVGSSLIGFTFGMLAA